jgi:hypothetical protein
VEASSGIYDRRNKGAGMSQDAVELPHSGGLRILGTLELSMEDRALNLI